MNRRVQPDLQALIRACGDLDQASQLCLKRGFEFADHAMKEQRRHNGELMIDHALRVAATLAAWGERSDVVMAGLLHDVPDFGIQDVELREAFGSVITGLVMGVQQLDADARDHGRLQPRDLPQVVRRVKIADRLDNSKSWDKVPVESARRKALETLGVYVEEARQLCPPSVSRDLARAATTTLAATQWPVHRLPAQRAAAEVVVPGAAVVRRLYQFAVGVLPPSLRARYAEEWLSDLASHSTIRERIRHASGLVYSAYSLRVRNSE